MFSMQWDKQTWCPIREWQLANMDIDKNMSAVLTVTTSLTRFLERHFHMALTVQLHEQFLDKVTASEAELLRCECAAPAIRRQVSLLHRGSVMFDAESVLPLEGLPKALMDELQVGKRPLANLLLDQGLSLARSDLSVTQVERGVCAGRWARRSVLRSASGTQALVVEVFQAEFWSRLQSLTMRK
ncbi:MAG: chorismate lyase [Mariprofundaceae bacterium]|nr:chorismate lyase [Mariprofundaceae bacterium]